MKKINLIFHRFLKSNNGSVLLQVVIIGGLVATASMVISKMTGISLRGQKKTSQNFEIEQSLYQIESFFRNSKVCKSTLFDKNPTGEGETVDEIISLQNIDSINVYTDIGADPLVDTDNIDDDERTAFSALSSKKSLLRANCGPPPSSDPDPCSLGTGSSGRVYIYDMKIKKFEVNANPYNSPLGSSQATLEFKVVRGETIRTGDLTRRSSSAGAIVQVKRIPITVSLDGNGKITSCATELEDYFDEGCEDLIGGKVDRSGNLKCKNIVIQSDSLSTNHPFSITSRKDTLVDGTQLVLKSIDVEEKLDDSNTYSPLGDNSPGSIRTDHGALIKDNLTITSGKLLLGPYGSERTSISSEVSKTLTVAEKNNPSKGIVQFETGAFLNGEGDMLSVQTAVDSLKNPIRISPSYHLDVKGTGKVSNDLFVEENIYAKQGLSIKSATLKLNGGKLQLNGGTVQIDESLNDGQDIENKDLMATRKWVYWIFKDRLGDVAVEGVFDEIIEHPGNALTSLKKSSCNNVNSNSLWGSSCSYNRNDNCSSGSAMKGFNSSGKVTCGNILPGSSCSSNQIATGIRENGSLNCVDATSHLKSTIGSFIY